MCDGRKRPTANGRSRDAVLSGDAEAWRLWYDAHFNPLAVYVRWRCGGCATSPMMSFKKRGSSRCAELRSFDPARGTFFDWLRGIASNTARARFAPDANRSRVNLAQTTTSRLVIQPRQLNRPSAWPRRWRLCPSTTKPCSARSIWINFR